MPNGSQIPWWMGDREIEFYIRTIALQWTPVLGEGFNRRLEDESVLSALYYAENLARDGYGPLEGGHPGASSHRELGRQAARLLANVNAYLASRRMIFQ